MKLFGTDIGIKYIEFKLKDGVNYLVQFRFSIWKGITDVIVYENGKKADIDIGIVYPPLKRWLPEIWRIYIPCWVKSKFNKFRRLHNR